MCLTVKQEDVIGPELASPWAFLLLGQRDDDCWFPFLSELIPSSCSFVTAFQINRTSD